MPTYDDINADYFLEYKGKKYRIADMRINSDSILEIEWYSSNRPAYQIEDIDILQPNKVMRVWVSRYGRDAKPIICVVSHPDTFDMTKGCFIALAKCAYGDKYTTEGIEFKATEFSYQKAYVKEVNRAIKSYYRKLEDKKKAEAEQAERAKIEERRKAKKAAKRARVKERKQLDIAEAILLAKQIEDQDKRLKKMLSTKTKSKKVEEQMKKAEAALQSNMVSNEEESVHTE